MDITFINASPKDSEQLVKIQDAAFESDFIKYGNCPAYHEPPDIMRREIADGSRIAYRILADNSDVGDIIIRKRQDGIFNLRVLAVIPQYQNRHIGKKAIEFLTNTYSEAAGWELITPMDNKRNCYFYESNGFVKYGEITDQGVPQLNKYRR